MSTILPTFDSHPALHDRYVAVPSWVIPGTIAQNAQYVARKVHEVGLCFFETDSCLSYTDKDLPANLADLPLSWHVHLPLDLPWRSGAEAAKYALALMEKVTYLHASRAVLHPPLLEAVRNTAHSAANVLRDFVAVWQQAGREPADLLLENIAGNDLVALWSVILETGCSVCLDTGHAVAYNQHELLALPQLAQKVRMVHLNAPAMGSGRHMPLTALDAHGKEMTQQMLALASDDAVLMMELFAWSDIEVSVPVLDELLKKQGEKA